VWRPTRRELRLWGQAAWRAFIGLVSRNDLTHAASIAYYSLLSLFPFLLLIISILGVMTDQLDAFRTYRVSIGLSGGIALVWASLGFFGAVTSAVNEAWGVEKQRSFWKHRLVSFLMLVAASAAMAGALLFVSFLQVAETSRIGQALANAPWFVALQTFLFRYLALVLLMFGTGLVFYFIPNANTRFRDVWVGAILTGLLWRIALSGFSWYVRQNERLSMIHGSITTVVVFLLWIYISSVILMYGVEFTAAYARLRRHRTEHMPAAASPRT
jgi:membrane protein